MCAAGGDGEAASLLATMYRRGQVSYTEIILVDALCPIQFWNAKCLN